MVAALSLKECAAPGCSALVDERVARCEACRREQVRDADARRERPYRQLYDTRRWRRLSAQYRKANPLCERCEAKGLTVPSEQVHHKQRPQEAPNLFWSWSNLEALCASCHSAETATEDGGFGRQRRVGGPGGVGSSGPGR